MSLNKSATRRLSLLCGASIVAATLSTATIILAPTPALAANECAPIGVAPSANGPIADTYACTGATLYQGTGITYSSQGNLTVNSTGAMDVGAVGVNLTGNGADNVAFTATGVLTGSSGAVVDITTVSGNINATTNGITGATGATGAIRMESAGAGNIVFARTGTNATGSINSDTATGDTAVTAISHGGNITMTIPTGASGSTALRGRQRGIVAETSGTGSVTITTTGSGGGVLTDREAGIAAVDVTAGSGGITLNLSRINSGYGDGANQPHGTGDGVLATTTGSINITVVNAGIAAGNDGIVAAAGGALNITNNSAIFTAFTTSGDAIRGTAGTGATITNNGTIGIASNGGLGSGPSASGGVVDLSGVTGGGVIFRNLGTGRWITNGDNAFSSQNDLLEMTGTGQSWFGEETTVAFGAGTDTFNMNARLIAEGALLTGLEAFNSSGEILLGWENTNGTIDDTDRLPNDYLSMPGVTFTGSGSSRIVLDVALGGASQVGCETLTGAADCLDLRGGATAGSTLLTINDATPGGMIPGYVPEGITVIDVNGGTSSAAHFTLDPASTGGYVHPLYGAAFDRPGAFVYVFRYDEENQRFILVGQPRDGSLFEYSILSGAAQSIWHMTSATVTSRQTDLRDGRDEPASVWLRTAGEVTRRDASQTFEAFDGPVVFDNSYNLYAGTIMGGIDLLSGGSGEFDYVLGAQIGYVSSSFEMDAAESSGRFTGATGGVYGGLWSDWFFLDGTVNLNGLALDYESPVLGSKTTTYVNSVGVAAEAGTRTMLTDNTFVEPLAVVSWVRTTFEEISLSAGEVQPDDAASARAGLGMRIGATLPGETVSASYFVTGRGWYEFEGETGGIIHNPGVDLPFTDEFTGAFGEAEVGINVFNASNTFSGFMTTGVKWKGDYSAVNLSLGVRMAW